MNTIKDEFLCEVRWKEWHPICKFSLIKFAFSAGIMLPSTWENLSRCSKKFNTCLEKKLPLAMDCRQSKHSQIIYIFFNFGCGFCGFFPILFPKAPASFWKKNWTNYYALYSIFMSSKSVFQIFKIIFQTGDINIFDLLGVFFSRCVKLKSSFSNEKKQR